MKIPKSRTIRTIIGASAKKEGREKRDIQMDVRRTLVNKIEAKKPFLTKASNNHTSETYVTEVCTSI